MEIFNCAILIDRRICEHDRHLPLVRYGIQTIETRVDFAVGSKPIYLNQFKSTTWTALAVAYTKDTMHRFDGTDTCSQFPIDAIFACPQGIFGPICFC